MASDNRGAPETIIGATVKVEGDLVSEGDIKIDGLVTGKIKTNKKQFPRRVYQRDNGESAGLR